MSLHTYVAHCSFFAILAPIQQHEDGRLMSHTSWLTRGWCQFELAVNVMLGAKPVLLVEGDTVRQMHTRTFFQLSPCCANFSKDEDRQFIADALTQVTEAMEESLRESKFLHRLQMLQVVRSQLLRCPDQSLSRPQPQERVAVPLEEGSWTELHYAAAQGDVKLVRALLKAGADVHARTLYGDLDFFLQAGQSPLHVWAAFSDCADVAEALVHHRAQ
ncbi:unnamed protein product, partial [Effrenium voratum]